MINTISEGTMSDNTNANLRDQPAAAAPTDQLENSPGGLFDVLWLRPWTILLTTVLALVAAYVHIDRATPLYTSTSRVYVEQKIPRIIRDSEEGVMSRSQNYLHTQAEVLRSAPVLTAALASPDMGRMQSFADVNSPIAALRAGLEIKVGKKDDIINVSFKSPYPSEAAQIVNTVVDAYVAFHGERKRTTTGELLTILQEEKAKRSAELIEKLERMRQFKQQHEGLVFGLNQNDNAVTRQMERLSAALTEAQLTTIRAESFYETVQGMTQDSAALGQFVEARRGRGAYATVTNEVVSLRTELKRMQRDRADCLLELKPDHPAIVALDAEIEQTQRHIVALDEQFVRNQLEVARQDYLAAKQSEEELARHHEARRQQLLSLHDQQAQYAILQSDYEQTRGLCDILDSRTKELSVTENVGGLNISILEPARASSVPSDPQRAKIMGIALLLGVCAGVGFGLIREARDQRLRSAPEISTLLKLPVIGVIPMIKAPLRSGVIRGQKVLISPTSPEAEAFRTLRMAVFFGAPRQEAKTILVTSSAPGEGKTIVVSNLALTMAQADQKVLILDADLRRPKQHKIFKKDPRVKGLSSVLTGQVVLEDAIESTDVDNLDILTCGPDVANPTEMLNSDNFARLVKTLADRYDRVLVDSPPVLLASDAQILASRCDMSVLVLRAEASTRRDSLHARDGLAGVNARILGIVVNAVPRNGSRFGCYSGYQYYYRNRFPHTRHRKQNHRRKQEKTAIVAAASRGHDLGGARASAGEVAQGQSV
ncbi:MAG: polysaccharide biosynthesis tyrosine autokinase [Phycisphaerales bacterium]|nr:MAG: polysaccharide biosynthesis tyrosine autokinase [Phycisphaerales bacterium]